MGNVILSCLVFVVPGVIIYGMILLAAYCGQKGWEAAGYPRGK